MVKVITVCNPARRPIRISESRGLYQATRESFSLLGNARATDALNFKMNLRIFEDHALRF